MPLINKLKAIANAIRLKTGTDKLMTLDEMTTEIENISLSKMLEEFLKVRGCKNLFGNNQTVTNSAIQTLLESISQCALYDMSYMFYNCKALTTCLLKNIKVNLTVGSGSSYGRLLTVESLLHLIQELINVNTSRTLTIGTTNLKKINTTYVKLVDITDEMRTEDPYVDQKLPFEVCKSTDEGAMLLTTTYVALKNWIIK